MQELIDQLRADEMKRTGENPNPGVPVNTAEVNIQREQLYVLQKIQKDIAVLKAIGIFFLVLTVIGIVVGLVAASNLSGTPRAYA